MTSSFYLHIPFCRQKCRYCKFALTPVWSDAKVEQYLWHLEREVRGYFVTDPSDKGGGEAGGFHDNVITPLPPLSGGQLLKTLYFGGGTPSILTPVQIGRIIDTFHEYRTFGADPEITLETNPEDISTEYIRAIHETGINRLSLGIQTLDDRSLAEIGRTPSDTITRALDAAVGWGIRNIGTDWILGLPHVAVGQTRRDIENILHRYPIAHLSLYMLESEQYPVHWKSLSTGEDGIRDEYLAIRDLLVAKWFIHYELSNFALPGYESCHNRAYWNHTNYRGFGLAAASYEDGRRFTNSASFSGYYRGELAEDETLSDEQLRIERCMFGLRTDGIKLADLRSPEKIDALLHAGLVEIRDEKILPTSTWIFLIDHIIGELI